MQPIFKFKLEDGTIVTGASPVEALMQVNAGTTGKTLDDKFKKEERNKEKNVAMLEFEKLYGEYIELKQKIKRGEKIEKSIEPTVGSEAPEVRIEVSEKSNDEKETKTEDETTNPEPQDTKTNSQEDVILDKVIEEIPRGVEQIKTSTEKDLEDLKNMSAEKLFEVVENAARELTDSVSTIYYILSGYSISGRITEEQNKAVLKMISEKYPDGNKVTPITLNKVQTIRKEVEEIKDNSKEAEIKNIFSEIGLPPRNRESVDPYDDSFFMRTVVEEDINDVFNIIKDINLSDYPALIDPIILNEQVQEIKLLKEKGASEDILRTKNKIYDERNKRKIAESYVNGKYKQWENDLIKSLEYLITEKDNKQNFNGTNESNENKEVPVIPAQELKEDFYGPVLRTDGSFSARAISLSPSSLMTLNFEKIPGKTEEILGQLILTPEIIKRALESPDYYILPCYNIVTKTTGTPKNITITKHTTFQRNGNDWIVSKKGELVLE